MNKSNICIYITIVILVIPYQLFGQRFTAYYTNLDDNYDALEMVQNKLFGKYADLMVEVGGFGKIEFSRKTSYLPVLIGKSAKWKFPELIIRRGDGDSNRPDIISRYSGVRLIESSDTKIIVHWRYFPDFENVEWDGVVEEYFEFSPDGMVLRTFRKGTKKIADWQDPANTVYKIYQLTGEGIKSREEKIEIPYQHPEQKRILATVQKLKERNSKIKFSFDDYLSGNINSVREINSGKEYLINGNNPNWREGISGSSLHFDGYYSSIRVDNRFVTTNLDELTIEAWVALAAYPFGWAPLVHQSRWNESGFYLGIGEDGYPGFFLSLEGKWISLVDSNRLDLYKWFHITGTYSRFSGEISIYVNGNLATAKQTPNESILLCESDLFIGLNEQKMPAIEGRINIGKWPSLFGVDGLIDEVNIYEYRMEPSDVRAIFHEYGFTGKNIKIPGISPRVLPLAENSSNQNRFGAEFKTLTYYDTWDNLWRVGDFADIVVSFKDLPAKLVSWRGTSYGPYFITENGKWVGDQSNEDYRLLEHPGEAEGCLEHMSDKQCRHSYIRIIENTDARVLLHWRYGLVDSRYKFAPGVDGWGGWTDEYWSIYPDGVAVRYVERGIVFGDGWVETMFLSAPGTKPEDNIELSAITIVEQNHKRYDLSWENGSPEGVFKKIMITRVNSKSNYRMFNIYPEESSVEVFGGHSRRSHFHWWNHWPASQITSDGRGARAADRAAHSSLIWGAPAANYLMYGITEKQPEELIPLAKSWRNPPAIIINDQIKKGDYIREERAYHILTQNNSIETLNFTINASQDSPLINPAFLVKNWNSEITDVYLNGKHLLIDEEYQCGSLSTPQGTDLIIFLNYFSDEELEIKLVKK